MLFLQCLYFTTNYLIRIVRTCVYQVYPQLLHLKVLLIFLLKIPNAAIEAPRSIPPIFLMFVEPQVGHLGLFNNSWAWAIPDCLGV